MKKHCFTIISFSIFLFTGCGHEQNMLDTKSAPAALQSAVVPTQQKGEETKYVYRGDRHPDPFIPQNTEAVPISGGEQATPSIAALSLKGIFSSGKQRTAIITGPGGTYILKDSRLYDNRQRIIKGLSGAIKADSVIMISQDKTMRELKLRDKE
jgi:Tfp pilus assembly protein PilP